MDAEKTSNRPQRVEIFLPSTLGYEKVARNAAAAVAEEMGFSEDRIEDLKTAVAEACMNAIEHGNQEVRTTSVTVLLTAAQKRLEVKVADEGVKPIPEEFPKPGRYGEDNRGWGMFFINQLMDEVEVSRLPDGGNQVKMVIYLAREGEEKAKDQPADDKGDKKAE